MQIDKLVYFNTVLEPVKPLSNIQFFQSIRIPFQCHISTGGTKVLKVSTPARRLRMTISGSGRFQSRYAAWFETVPTSITTHWCCLTSITLQWTEWLFSSYDAKLTIRIYRQMSYYGSVKMMWKCYKFVNIAYKVSIGLNVPDEAYGGCAKCFTINLLIFFKQYVFSEWRQKNWRWILKPDQLPSRGENKCGNKIRGERSCVLP